MRSFVTSVYVNFTLTEKNRVWAYNPFRGGARLALITLAGRTELPVMAVFREFVSSQLVD